MSFDYVAKVGLLMKQAERAGSPEEAAQATEMAQKLASTYGISMDVARNNQANKEKRETPTQKRIVIGDSGKKGLKYYCRLFLAIARQNDVRCNLAHNSSYVIAFGFPSDIAMVELLYTSLIVQMIDSSDRYVRSGAYKNEMMSVDVWETEYDSWTGKNKRYHAGTKVKPVDGRVARSNFQEAFISTITTRLSRARAEAVSEAKAIDVEPTASGQTGTELALINKAVEIRDFYKSASTAKGSWGGMSGSKGYSSGARNAGAQAGSRASIGSRAAIGGSRRAIG